jgi:hypothetical protein
MRHVATLIAGFTLATLAPAATARAQDGLVAWWRFTEGAGSTVADASGNGLSGQLVGGAWGQGVLGPCVVLAGGEDAVDFRQNGSAPPAVSSLAVGTISVWFRFDRPTEVNQVHTLLYMGDGAGGPGHDGLIIEVGHFNPGDHRLFFTVLTGGVIPQCFDTGFFLDVGRWYHFAAVVGPGFNTGYLDGAEMVDRHYSFGGPTDHYFFADVASHDAFWLGRGVLGTLTFAQSAHAAIDEVRIYDRPLSADEIADHVDDVLAGCGADCNKDGQTNIFDFLCFQGLVATADPAADCNADGVINIFDFLAFQGKVAAGC